MMFLYAKSIITVVLSFDVIKFEEKIVLNRVFAESLANDLNNLSQGKILLRATNEILIDPTFVFGYNMQSGFRFPGRYHLVLVAMQRLSPLNSIGGRIDLSGSNGSTPETLAKADSGVEGSRGTDGNDAHDGGNGGVGMNIKIYCNELDLENIEIFSNGGDGGNGGVGQEGGDGGDSVPADGILRAGSGGSGGNGGNGGHGGNGGSVEIIYCNSLTPIEVAKHLHSNGGKGGKPARGGFPGSAGSGSPPIQPGGRPGKDGIMEGTNGIDSIPKVERVGSFAEILDRINAELGSLLSIDSGLKSGTDSHEDSNSCQTQQ
jgi:hypothetical protein